MPELPTGMVTFLFTDLEGSTRLWEHSPEAMRQALIRHDALIESLTGAHDGTIVRPRGEGDSRFAVFAQTSSAVTAAAAIQQAMHAECWLTPAPLRVRIALHTGEADLRMGDYYGSGVNRCARLRALAAGGQTLLTAAAAQLARDYLPTGVRLNDLGEHRLKDLDRAEHVFQLIIDGLPNAFPPLRSLDAFPNNLPLQLTSFIGREKETAEVKRLLDSTRFLTLTGSGGSGKTRLALQVAAELLDTCKDGAWLIELAPVSDPAFVPNVLAAVLGVRETQNARLIDVLTDYLYDKQALIVLDNCEHLIMACAEMADTLLHSCPNLKILATSREALSVMGETAWRIPSLTLPDSNGAETLEHLAGCEAIQFFTERAKAARPDFILTNQNAPAVVQVCRHLDGIPLAIELATTRIRGMSVEQIAARLDDRFRLLTGGSRTALTRHQTLRTLIDWSYGLLSETERTLLCRLSVFVGGWTMEACEMVCCGEAIEPGEVMDLLLQLVNKSLVTLEEHGDDTRYRLLETIRQYSRDKLLDSGEGEAMRDRHMNWCVHMTETLVLGFRKAGKISLLKRRLDLELDNLRTALEWASTRNLDACFRLAGAVFPIVRSAETLGSTLRSLLPEALARDAANAVHTAPAVRAGALWALGAIYLGQGDNATAQLILDQSIQIYRRIEDKQGLAEALATLAAGYEMSGDVVAARKTLQEATTLFQQLGENWGLATSFDSVAQGLFFTGDYGMARACAEQSLALCREIGDTWAMVNPLLVLGQIAAINGESEMARARLEEGLAIARELGDSQLAARILSALGKLARDQKDFGRAKVIYAEVLDLWRRAGNRGAVALVQQLFGYMVVAEGDYPAARSHFEESLSIRQRLDNPLELAGPLEGLACLAAAEGNDRRAARLFGAANAIRGVSGFFLESYDIPEVEQAYAYLHTRLNDSDFDAFWSEGHDMTVEQAITNAFSTDEYRIDHTSRP